MVHLYRCAACGSPRVVADTKAEGYSLSKAFVGTMIIGPVGAVAGVNGKSKYYYHCPDCGATLSYPMGASTASMIDKYLQNPSLNTSALSVWKERYKNIEWEPERLHNPISNSSNALMNEWDERALQRLSEPLEDSIGMGSVGYSLPKDRLEIIDELKTRVLRYIKITKCKQFTSDDLEKVLGIDHYPLQKDKIGFSSALETALVKLYVEDAIEDNGSAYIVLDEKQRKARGQLELNNQVASKILQNNKTEIQKAFTQELEFNKMITKPEIEAVFFDVIIKSELTDDPGVIQSLFNYTIQELLEHELIIKKTLDDGTDVYAQLDDEGKKALEEEKKRELQKEIEEAKRVISNKVSEAKKIFMIIEDEIADDQEFTFRDSYKIAGRFRSIQDVYSRSQFNDILRWCVYCNLLEYKSGSLSKIGVHARNYEKQQEELKKQKENLHNTLKELQQKQVYLENKEEKLKREQLEKEKIIAENKNKIFGAGARERKEAQSKLLSIEAEIGRNKDEIMRNEGKIVTTKITIDKILQKEINIPRRGVLPDDVEQRRILEIMRTIDSPASVAMVFNASDGYFKDEKHVKHLMSDMKTSLILRSVNVNDIDYFVICLHVVSSIGLYKSSL